VRTPNVATNLYGCAVISHTDINYVMNIRNTEGMGVSILAYNYHVYVKIYVR